MVLAFRSRDYDIIKETAEQIGESIGDAIVHAVKFIGTDPNFYTNPNHPEDYSTVGMVELDITKEDFRYMVDKANFHNYSVEMFVCEAMKIYKAAMMDRESEAAVRLVHH